MESTLQLDDGDDEASAFASYLEKYSVHVAKADFKFNAAHFVAYKGFRERCVQPVCPCAADLLPPCLLLNNMPWLLVLPLQCLPCRLHGHNYTVGVRLEAEGVRHDGYVMDFGDIKKVARKLCKELNELFLCPERSDVMEISKTDDTLTIKWCACVLDACMSHAWVWLSQLCGGWDLSRGLACLVCQHLPAVSGFLCGRQAAGISSLTVLPTYPACFPACVPAFLSPSEDGATFSFPLKDAAMLPIKHSTVEELAHYFCTKIIESYTMARLLSRGAENTHRSGFAPFCAWKASTCQDRLGTNTRRNLKAEGGLRRHHGDPRDRV
jgi:6-pyruvoyl-tetrahydropterin synthase